MRVDHWLRQRYPQLSRRHVEEALSQRFVTTPGGGSLARGGSVDLQAPPLCARLEGHLATLLSGNPALSVPIILELPDLVVVDKPAGMPSHPLSLLERDTITHWAMARYPEICRWATQCQPTITPHRLDTGTSGALLVARTGAGYEQWRRRFTQKHVEKTYLAWCWGKGPAAPAVCKFDIAHAPGDRRRMVALPAGRTREPERIFSAETRIRTREQFAGYFLAELAMHTGVTHQIRVHMAAMGYPLLGDALYDPQINHRGIEFPNALLRCVRILSEDLDVCAEQESFNSDPCAGPNPS